MGGFFLPFSDISYMLLDIFNAIFSSECKMFPYLILESNDLGQSYDIEITLK